MADGFVKALRAADEAGLFGQGDLRIGGLYLWMLYRANWRPGRLDHGVEVPVGSLARTLQGMAEAHGTTVKVIRGLLAKLEKMGLIVGKNRANRVHVIAICNYDSCNCLENSEGQTDGRPRASQGQTEGKPRAEREELKNLRTTPSIVSPTEEQDGTVDEESRDAPGVALEVLGCLERSGTWGQMQRGTFAVGMIEAVAKSRGPGRMLEEARWYEVHHGDGYVPQLHVIHDLKKWAGIRAAMDRAGAETHAADEPIELLATPAERRADPAVVAGILGEW